MAVAGISKLDLKRQNRMQVIRLLRSSGPTSRIDIAREVGITKAAVTIITNEMIQHGILYEKGEQAPKGAKLSRGRKKILLDIDPAHKMDMGLGLDSGILSFGICLKIVPIMLYNRYPQSLCLQAGDQLFQISCFPCIRIRSKGQYRQAHGTFSSPQK